MISVVSPWYRAEYGHSWRSDRTYRSRTVVVGERGHIVTTECSRSGGKRFKSYLFDETCAYCESSTLLEVWVCSKATSSSVDLLNDSYF